MHIDIMVLGMRDFQGQRQRATNHARDGGVVVLINRRTGRPVCQICPVDESILRRLPNDGTIQA